MFDYKQDTGLLHYSLESAASTLRSDKNSKNLCGIEDVKAAVKQVSSTVNKIFTLNLYGIKDEMEIIKIQLHINRRLHAVLFFTTLRSCGIISVQADKFYSSVCYVFPSLDWKFYIELSMQCHWSEYFIECAQQLPSKILAVVLKKVLEISQEKSVKYYSWHLVLQSVLKKSFILEKDLSSEVKWPFHFNFTCKSPSDMPTNSQDLPDNCDRSKSTTSDLENNNSESKSDFELLLNLYKHVYDLIYKEYMCENENVDLINIIFHALTTMFKLLTLTEKFNESFLEEFDKLYELFKKCILLDSTQKLIRLLMNIYVQPVVSHIYATASWGISESYLNFILYYSWNSLMEKFSMGSIPRSEHPSDVDQFLKKLSNPQLFDLLHSLNPLFQDFKNADDMEHHIYLLAKMVQCQYEFANRAARIILSHHTLLERDDVMCILEKRTSILDIFHMHPLFTNAIIKMESDERRIRLLELFFKMLSEAPLEIFNDVVQNILISGCEKFQLPDITNKLGFISRKVLSFQEAQHILPPLFMQSPKLVLKNVIALALLQGEDSRALLQVLKIVPAVCKFPSSVENIPLLILELKNYIEKDELELFESKNMIYLYKHLMDVHSEKSILELDCLFSECFIPGLCFENKNVDICLECLNITLRILLKKRMLQMNSQNLISLVKSLAEMLNNCVKFGLGKYKEDAMTALFLLEEYLRDRVMDDLFQDNLVCVLSSLNPATALYVSALLQEEIDVPNLPYELLFIWCCIKKETSIFEERIRDDNLPYADLLNIIKQLLAHFTADEWLYLASLIRIYFKCLPRDKTITASDASWRLSESNFQLYEVIRCFIESLHFLLWENCGDMSYISNCFSNTLKKLLKEESSLESQFLLKVLLDVCYLVSRIRPDSISLFTSILIDLVNSMTICCTDESSKSNCQRITLLAVNGLPKFPEKERFLKKITNL